VVARRVARDPLARASELRLRGVAENNAGRPLNAVKLFRRAHRLVESVTDPELERDRRVLAARIQISMAMSESELNGLDRGLAALAEIDRDNAATGDPEIAVHLHLQHGYMRVRGGHFEAGLHHLDDAVRLIEHADPAAACNILMNRGMTHLYRGDLNRARTDFQGAVDRARRNGLVIEEVKARHNVGCVEGLAGNLALALSIMDASRYVQVDVSQAVILVDRARVLIEAGLHREADEALQVAGVLFRRDRLWKDVGEVELARAECALLDGELATARRLAGTARTRFRRRRNDAWRRSAELVLLQADLAAERPGSRLAGPAARLAREFFAEGLLTAARTAELIAAEALLRAGRVSEASAAAASAGPVRPSDSIGMRLHTSLVRALLKLAEGSTPEGRREIREGLTELARYQASFGSIDLQTASAVHGRQLADLDLAMALTEGRPEAVLAAVERGRATSNRLLPVSAPTDETAAALLAELRRTSEALRVLESDPAAAHALVEQRRRIVEIQRALRSRAWQTDGSGQAQRPARLREISAALSAADAALACYVQDAGRLHAVVLSGGRSRIVGLGSAAEVTELARRIRADLDVVANGHLPPPMHDVVLASLHRSLAELDERVVAPLQAGERRLVVVPTGMLAAAPWTILPSLTGRPVVVSPSATAWLAAARGTRAAAPTVAAFAGPDLVRSAEEVKAIGVLWPDAAVYTDDAARQDALVSALTSATVVHVAAHGQHQAENPLFSSIRLADGPVFAYELDQTARAAEHVVLSACELGQATIRPGDEALGLTSVLLHLGTRCVVSGVARVHDDVAAQVMARYHRGLATGLDSASALAGACAAEDTLTAPFVCFGAAFTMARQPGRAA
jgi:predicted metal-dependent hydrolase